MIPPFLVGPAFGAAGMALAALLFWGWLGLVHDPKILAAHTAEIATMTAKQEAKDRAKAEAAAAESDEAARVRSSERVVIRERIIRVPVTQACIASPAIAAALIGLRERAADAGAPDSADKPLGVPARAPAAVRAER